LMNKTEKSKSGTSARLLRRRSRGCFTSYGRETA